MNKIAIVYHSGFGHTHMQARHVLDGANSVEGVVARLLRADEATEHLDALSEVDAMILGSPTYMGSVSAPFKAFMDASSAVWATQAWKDKIAAGFTNSYSMSGDKLSTLMGLAVFAMQHGMIWVGQAELNASPPGRPADPEVINRMGSFLGAMAQSENDSPEVTPPIGDLKTAYALGARVAMLTKRFHHRAHDARRQ